VMEVEGLDAGYVLVEVSEKVVQFDVDAQSITVATTLVAYLHNSGTPRTFQGLPKTLTLERRRHRLFYDRNVGLSFTWAPKDHKRLRVRKERALKACRSNRSCDMPNIRSVPYQRSITMVAAYAG